jgi:hypothetical protein
LFLVVTQRRPPSVMVFNEFYVWGHPVCNKFKIYLCHWQDA